MKKDFVIGLATGLTIAGASLVLANSQIQAILNDQIKVTLNGQVQEFKDETTNETQYPITYHDRTYLPLRTVANLVGVDVDYDASSNTAMLKNAKDINTNYFDSDELLTDAEVLGLGNMMYKLANDAYNSNSIEIDRNEQPYKVLNIDYYKEIFTENKFKKFSGMEKDNSNHEVGNIVYENGNYYFVDNLGRGPEHYLGSKLVIKSKDTDKIEFEVITSLSNDGRLDAILDEMNKDRINDKFQIICEQNPFVLVKENGKWKIDEFVHTFWERK